MSLKCILKCFSVASPGLLISVLLSWSQFKNNPQNSRGATSAWRVESANPAALKYPIVRDARRDTWGAAVPSGGWGSAGLFLGWAERPARAPDAAAGSPGGSPCMDQVNSQEGAVALKSPKKRSKNNTVGWSDFSISPFQLNFKGRSYNTCSYGHILPVFILQLCNQLSLLLVGIKVEAQVWRRTLLLEAQSDKEKRNT